ncbi:pyridoxal-phosphate dependent enzyme [Arundinibacter roseus]|uniref:Pyridoxal-phosphate dependent enzyme n=1 Tax=Arundinibacter roseus TaxID=2070510 RepID=A0A4R4KKA4_9BACT|nr:pyridoxal-phosphate dependent enzyme [Arundinibacter roseus]
MDFLIPFGPTRLQRLLDAPTQRAGIDLYLKRDDEIHPEISGNKWRKLKFSLLEIQKSGYESLITFGGARSNHLYAAAAAGKALGIKTFGVIRGDEFAEKDTETLHFCRAQGMTLLPVSRELYRQKEDPNFLQNFTVDFGKYLLLPEGGTTALALPGVREVVDETEKQLGFSADAYTVAAGTGGTAAGLLSAPTSRVLAFSALKGGDFLFGDILKWINEPTAAQRLTLRTDYHFGGYARHTPELIRFMSEFEQRHSVLLEHVYTGKMLYGVYDLMRKNFFTPGSTIVAIHTGGLQGRSHENKN